MTASPTALDPDTLISIDAKDMSALRLLELMLEQAARDSFEENTWQMTSWGSIEIGPKSLLNRRQRVVIYDISDLLLETARLRRGAATSICRVCCRS